MAEVQVQRDPEFYFSFRTFQVEDTLYRVPRHLFLIPENVQAQPMPEGTDNGDDLVVLDDIKKDDFLQLLRAVYPRHYNTPEILTANQWQAVFRLSSAFGMEEVRTKAARQLKDSFFAGDLVDALLCAKDNGLEDWIAPLIDKIVREKRDLSEGELNRIGIKLAMRIAKVQGATEAGGAQRRRGRRD